MITPDQYYFPYLFNAAAFNKKLEPFGLSSFSSLDAASQMPEKLLITGNDQNDILLTIAFGSTLMVEDDNLFYWETDTDIINIVQVSLQNLTPDPWLLTARVDLASFYPGKYTFNALPDAKYFITYSRKNSIEYHRKPHEKFVVVIIEKEHISIIPFDWFNETHTEYEYAWPALAKLDTEKGKLYGRGMRMKDFCTDIDKGWLFF